MPLKLLKRTSKQYNVVSKSTFVISVTLLDNGIMECTLDSDSTGTDCLHNISQRLGLNQPEFFGLRYISRGVPPRQRWIELAQPLKKQLDKYAEDSQLSLGVMFYVSDVNLLRDEMARYHYFLQLKGDVIDGKLNCNIDQAIALAAYSLQAEFGDYDPERHTVEYLRDFAILPKDLTSEEESSEMNLDAVYDAIARQYGCFVGFPSSLAEIYYILVAQQLDGYGQECYPAKDDSGNDILICVSMNGLVIRRRDWTHIAAFRWRNIKSLMGHKKTFLLESVQSQRTMQFHFSDAEVVKYVRKICILQGTFQKENLKPEQQPPNSGESQKQSSNVSYLAHTSSGTDSFVSSLPSHSSSNANLRATPDPSSRYGIGSQNSLNNNLAHHSKASGFNLSFFQNNSLPAPQYGGNPILQQQSMTQLHFHRSLQELSGQSQYGRPLTPMMPELSPAGVPLNHSLSLNPSGTTQDCDVQALLPSYRPAPDYDTAVQYKYGRLPQQPGTSNLIGNPTGEPRNFAQLYYETEKEEEEPIYQNEIVSKMNSIELRDSREAHGQQKRTPTPEVIEQESQHQGQAASGESSHTYKPPPPYPGTSYPQSLEPVPRQLGAAGGITNPTPPVTKTRSSFNTHADALKQISSELNNPTVGLSRSSNNSLSFTPPNSSDGSASASVSMSCSRTGAMSSKESLGSMSIIKELTKTTGAEVARGNTAENGTSRSDTGHNCPSMEDMTPQTSSAKLPFSTKPIDSTIMKEFQGIQKAKINPNFSTGMKRENAKRNRTPNVLPYEDNSIRLCPSRQNPDGYINASPVSVQLGDRTWKYNVGQIPLSGNGNATALWQMIWETESKIVVSLERDSSAPFYPSEKNPTLTFGDFQLADSKNQRFTPKASIARELIVTFLPKKKQRRVWVLPYEDEWREDVPVDTEHFLCFLEEVNSVQRKVSEDLTPLTVLCGNGSGRSGVFVLSDLLLHSADSGHKIRCDNLLSELRTERMLLVSHPPQYAFVLDTLAKYLAQSRLI